MPTLHVMAVNVSISQQLENQIYDPASMDRRNEMNLVTGRFSVEIL